MRPLVARGWRWSLERPSPGITECSERWQMKADDPVALEVMRRSMVARIGTCSRSGRPSITPLYFVPVGGHLWLGTVDWTLAVRHVKADPRVSVLLEVERDPGAHRVLRISGRASVRADRKVQRSYNLRVARKYLLTEPPRVYWRLRCFGFQIDYSVVLSH